MADDSYVPLASVSGKATQEWVSIPVKDHNHAQISLGKLFAAVERKEMALIQAELRVMAELLQLM